MKVLFLDIDGVLNSRRSCLALGGYPHGFSDKCMAMFDMVAVNLIRRLCQAGDVKIVVSSSWRIGREHEEIGRGLDLPTIGKTPSLPACRGQEIAVWLEGHEVEAYAIVDDDSDMLPEQMPFFVKTNGIEGLTFDAYEKLCSVLGVEAYGALAIRDRIHTTEKLFWEPEPPPSISDKD